MVEMVTALARKNRANAVVGLPRHVAMLVTLLHYGFHTMEGNYDATLQRIYKQGRAGTDRTPPSAALLRQEFRRSSRTAASSWREGLEAGTLAVPDAESLGRCQVSQPGTAAPAGSDDPGRPLASFDNTTSSLPPGNDWAPCPYRLAHRIEQGRAHPADAAPMTMRPGRQLDDIDQPQPR